MRAARSKPKDNRATLFIKDSWIHVRTPYNPTFIEELKNDIPRSARKWNGEEKVWMVDPSYLDDVVDLCERFFQVSVVDTQPDVVQVAVASPEDAYGRMLKLASPATLKKVYRMIAMELHPDHGGDPEKMVALNQAWAEINK